MAISELKLTIKQKNRSDKVVVEMDAESFERLAANLGLFKEEFLASLSRAEREISQGKVHPLRSFKDLSP